MPRGLRRTSRAAARPPRPRGPRSRKKNKGQAAEEDEAKREEVEGGDPLGAGRRVRLHGLSTALLNGATGCVVGPAVRAVPVGASGGGLQAEDRLPVQIEGPPEAAAAYPQPVKVKRANLQPV